MGDAPGPTDADSTRPGDPPRRCYAHTLPPPAKQRDWELLDVHADEVARLAEQFAGAFDASEWGRLAGLWHDLGKVQHEFQAYIRGEHKGGPPHAWVGAVHAVMENSKTLLPVAAAIAAHHGSLANVTADEADGIADNGTLSDMIARRRDEYKQLRALIPSAFRLPQTPPPSFPPYVAAPPSDAAKVEMFTRFLFSALVDADRLATAHFYARHVPALTADDLMYDNIATLRDRLDASIDAMPAKGSPAVVELRRQVLDACRATAVTPPGRFSLTVPTGGGKTLSAMSFALNHAQEHGLRRVIVVIPYTSIIEQSARVYASVLNDPGRPGVNNVLEHHSNFDEQKLTEFDAKAENLRKLATENWDAPVIVTTTVQFFQSLLADHGSRCRKVHNIARSVVLLDEVQTLPPHLLRTVVDVLRQLTDGYGCSVVLATATPPALRAKPGSPLPGLSGVTEIMPNPSALAAAAKRVRVEWRIDEPTPYAALAEELCTHRQVLAIVHRRADARTLVELMGRNCLHLSAAMCPAHRIEVIAEVRRRLGAREPCRLVSTQLIEAGVDVDFPVVYRALAGLDSIAQSAGRCDREGKLTDAAGEPAGRMVVFRAETEPPPGTLRKAFESMGMMLQLGDVDPFEPNDSIRFFEELYGKIDADPHRVEHLRRRLAFAAVAEKFKIIDSVMHSVVVPHGDGLARLAAFRAAPSRQTARALQPFIVQVQQYTRDALREGGVIMAVDDFERFDAVNEGREVAYDPTFGLDERVTSDLPPEVSVV